MTDENPATIKGRRARRRGIRFEQEVARWIGVPTTRNVRPGIHDDAGDILLPGFLVECKAQATLRLPQWWRELCVKCGPDDSPVLIVRRSGFGVAKALVYERNEHGDRGNPCTLEQWWPQDDEGVTP